jgi:hypothetical protein
MSPAQPGNLGENEGVRIWQHQVSKRRLLDDAEGHPVEIIYPGRRNDGRGGDFRDAVVVSGNSWKSGDIEIHTRSSGWQAHGHHLNPAYNRVVLHVALEQDRPGKTVLQNGQAIPTVILDRYIEQDFENQVFLCRCRDIASSPEKITQYLDQAGDRRFFMGALKYQIELAQLEDGQSLYQGVLEALGYTKNKKPFLELASRVPLCSLEKVANRKGAKEDILAQLQAVLLHGAWGLNWELYKVRPENSPVRRITALSHLIYRYRLQGWLPTLMNIIRHNPAGRVRRKLENTFIVDEGSHVLLGRDRASEIIINVVLPFAWSWGRKSSESGLSDKVEEVYRCYSRLGINSIERHMLQQWSLEGRLVNSARRQQGLIHIYKTFCTNGKCQECGLNYSEPGRVFSRQQPPSFGESNGAAGYRKRP